MERLHCGTCDITSLSPLVALTAMRTLSVRCTSVSDLTPLAALTALKVLDCSLTRISDLTPLSTLTASRSLDCRICYVVLDVSVLSALTALRIAS